MIDDDKVPHLRSKKPNGADDGLDYSAIDRNSTLGDATRFHRITLI